MHAMLMDPDEKVRGRIHRAARAEGDFELEADEEPGETGADGRPSEQVPLHLQEPDGDAIPTTPPGTPRYWMPEDRAQPSRLPAAEEAADDIGAIDMDGGLGSSRCEEAARRHWRSQ